MNLGELLDARVLDHDGVPVGHVVDVRLALDVLEDDVADPAAVDSLADQVGQHDVVGAAEVLGLLVSPRTGTSFLGYERNRVRSPTLVASLVRYLHRGTFFVAWDHVESIADGVVQLAEGFERADPALP